MGPARSCVLSGAGLSAVGMGCQGQSQAGWTNRALKTRNICLLTYCGDSRVCFTAELLGLHCSLSCYVYYLMQNWPNKMEGFPYRTHLKKEWIFSSRLATTGCICIFHTESVNSFKIELSAIRHPATLLSSRLFFLSSAAYLLLCSFSLNTLFHPIPPPQSPSSPFLC